MIVPVRHWRGSVILCVLLALAVAPWQGVRAQDISAARLADIRYALNELYFSLQGLRLELLQSELQLQPATPSDGGLVQRLDAIETEVRGYINQIETLEFRINEIAAEGIHSIRTLREEIVRLEQEIDFGASPELAINGQIDPGPTETLPAEDDPMSTLAVGVPDDDRDPVALTPEMQRYNDATQLYSARNYAATIDAMTAFLADYPQTSLESRARLYMAESHAALGAFEEARKSYLASIVADRGGALTPTVMLRLGQGLMDVKQTEQACRLLRTLTEQYPDHANARIAGVLMQRGACDG